MLKDYYLMTKPGIIYGNLLTTVGGYMLASAGRINLTLLSALLVGTSLVIASACVFNNYIDRDIDQKMARTKDRALATGQISNGNALTFASVLGVGGFLILVSFTNDLTVFIALFALVTYVVLYSIGKRFTVYGTSIGSLAGAAPPVAGYCAASGRFDMGAILLGLILVLWQMPHFYAIALNRQDDYAAAGIPVLPLKKSIQFTKVAILLYIMSFTLSTQLLSLYGYTGFTFLVVMAASGLGWLWLGINEYNTKTKSWAKNMFKFSLIVILLFSVTLAATPLLP